jgi:hypothetical protein
MSPTPITDAFFAAGYPRTQVETMEQMRDLEQKLGDTRKAELAEQSEKLDLGLKLKRANDTIKLALDVLYSVNGITPATHRDLIEACNGVSSLTNHLRNESAAAVKEANRRDAKWMAGIEEACGRKIRFDVPTLTLEGQDPTLEQFINSLKTGAAKTVKEMAALFITLALYPNAPAEMFPAGWTHEGEENPDLALGTNNDYWLKTDHEKGGLYLQSRYPVGSLKESLSRAVRVIRATETLEKYLHIGVRLSWDRKQIFHDYYSTTRVD